MIRTLNLRCYAGPLDSAVSGTKQHRGTKRHSVGTAPPRTLCSQRRRLIQSMLAGGMVLTVPGPWGVKRAKATTSLVDLNPETARRTLERAAAFYAQNAAVHGGYAYYYEIESGQHWGEGRVDQETILVQPPGTPTVGEALLDLYQTTGDPLALESTITAARALIQGQLKSGGWTQIIEFEPNRRSGDYRLRRGGRRNTSSLDDDQTQSALRFLARVDSLLQFRDQEIHEAYQFGLDSLLGAQFPTGAFPQVWTEPSRDIPVLQAQYPEAGWQALPRIKNYWDYPTLNDGLAGTVTETLWTAHRIADDPRPLQALRRLGDFLIRAQMPDPQPAWCQQYDEQMRPMWARKFEPPAIASHESQDAMETLVRIAEFTNDSNYLQPIERAIAYLRRECLLPDGALYRFYELQTNRPLFINGDYQIEFDPERAVGHYGWKFNSQLDAIQRRARQVSQKIDRPSTPQKRPPASTSERPCAEWSVDRVERAAQMAVQQLDESGRWISVYDGERLVGQPGFHAGLRYLSSEIFSRNVHALCEYLRRSERG